MTAPEEQMTSAEALAEAFELGSSLAELRAEQRHTSADVKKILDVVTDTQTRLGALEIRQATDSQRIASLEKSDGKVDTETRDRALKNENTIVEIRQDLHELSNRVSGFGLTWPKVGALVVSVGGFIAILGWFDSLTPGT